KWLFILAALWMLLVAQLATAQTPTPSPATTPDFQSVIARQASLVTEFDVNGLKVLVKKREGSQTVAAGLFIRGGVENISSTNAGVEAFMLNVASEASANYPRERLRKELARMGTVIGESVNYDYSALSMTATRANFDHSWDILTDVALHPAFTKEDVDLVKSRLVASLSDDEDEPDSYLQRLQEKVAYAGHPYLNRPQGTAETVKKLTAEDLRAYHQRVMQTSHLLLVVVGDIDAMQLKARLAATFGKLLRGDYKAQTTPPLTFNASTLEVTTRELPTNYVQGFYTAPPITSADIYPMYVASSLLRDRVFEEVRVKRNLSYAPDAFLRTQAANIGGIYVTAVDANQAVRVMLNEMTRLQREPVSKDDISSVIAQFLTTYYIGQETNAAQAGGLAQYELIGGGWRNSLQFLEKLRAVAPADVQRVSQKYMRNIRFVVLGNPAQIDKSVFTGQAGN
ncbi:MAG TPA: pitrilysin family protein, partial [Pyrinomonadaceae bacterium]|nr:pitrilysin family protein [Pyrinomonadaceae bacterium]